MNFDKFAATFQKPDAKASGPEFRPEAQVHEVVLARTVLATTKESCCIDVNGTQYEMAASDVIDIQRLPAGAGKGAEDAAASKGPQIVLIKMNSNAVLLRRIPVQAALVAAAGLWISVTPPAAKAAEEPAQKSK